jgi:uncharacterized protein (TIGR02453 family)
VDENGGRAVGDTNIERRTSNIEQWVGLQSCGPARYHVPMPHTSHFQPALFKFLRDLKRNNTREWFQANKERYERDVKVPLLHFISDFGPQLNKISPHFLADPRPVGGSMFRIYRDTRFSKDKTPYKTAASAHFRHESAKDVHAPGFYLHLEPGSVFAGIGLWHPDSPTQRAIRDAIVENPTQWKRAVGSKAFKERFEIGGESLRRPPRGYDPDHPLIEVLKLKDYVGSTPFSEKDACAPDFLNRFTAAMRTTKPFMGFLTKAVGLPF